MANSLFFCKNAVDIKADLKEVARYLGYSKNQPPDEKVSSLILECTQELHKVLVPKLVYSVFDLKVESDRISFASCNILSHSLFLNLSGCSQVLVFAATIGQAVDNLIRKAQYLDPVKTGIMQSAGAMFIESFVDEFNDNIKAAYSEKNRKTHPRFSPGYGDVSLEIQKNIFSLLDCNKIGLTLMESLIMAPEKSVTAFIGLEA